jgi:integrase
VNTCVGFGGISRLIRACYRQEAALDRSLPTALPTSGIKLKKRRASQKVLDFEVFPAWRKAWEKIENPVHRGYHLTALLTGIRPGELGNLRLDDVDLEKRMLIVRNPKAELDINLPITPQIAYALMLSINAPAADDHSKGPARNEAGRSPRRRAQEAARRGQT